MKFWPPQSFVVVVVLQFQFFNNANNLRDNNA